ncbi:MAG: NAD(P)/FAD-dependent oxidoreductase [Chloroflexi bacterium]|nr:NAD(P)/FAD-dependent oxidoreductase [Chloroflexota bacterium]
MPDLIVIGGGPAGVSAALRGRELGATVSLVERGPMGGVCTNDGCVPTRVLAHAARLVRDGQQAGSYGIRATEPSIDLPRLMARTRRLVRAVHSRKRLREHLDRAGVEVFRGSARFVDPGHVRVGRRTMAARAFVIAAGGHPRRPPFPGADLALTHDEVFGLDRLPRSMVIVGAAATGCQLASVFAAFGSRVRLLEIAPRILPAEDLLVAETLAGALAGHGVRIETGIGGIDAIDARGGGGRRIRYRSAGGKTTSVRADVAVLAVGWPGNVDALGTDAAGIVVERGYVRVDEELRTSAPGIFAAGDVTGRMMLVQSATVEGRVAAENAVGGTHLVATHAITPHGGFTDPEYGSVGVSEEQARNSGPVSVAVVPYRDLDRALIDGRPGGAFKLVVDARTRRILGAHAVGEQATEVVQLVAAAMAASARVEDLAQLELAYPTFTAIAGLAARQIVRELGVVRLSPAWRTLLEPRAAEWERGGAG